MLVGHAVAAIATDLCPDVENRDVARATGRQQLFGLRYQSAGGRREVGVLQEIVLQINQDQGRAHIQVVRQSGLPCSLRLLTCRLFQGSGICQQPRLNSFCNPISHLICADDGRIRTGDIRGADPGKEHLFH